MNRDHLLTGLVLALCSLFLTARSGLAQPLDSRRGSAGVSCSGIADNFACPEEPTVRDTALERMLSAQYGSTGCFGFLRFDEFPGRPDCGGGPIPGNALFVHKMTFAVPVGGVTSATLTFRARACPSGQTNSDFVFFFEGSSYVTGCMLKQLPGSSGTWNPNQDATFSVDLSNLPSGFSARNVLQILNDGDLDVVIGSGTGVDWMCLDLSKRCTPPPPRYGRLVAAG